MGNVFTYRMPAGIPGTLTRTEHATVEAGVYDASSPPVAYGRFCKIVSGKVKIIEANDTAAVAHALLVRPYPTQGGQADAQGSGTVATGGLADLCKRGYMMVVNNAGTPAKDGQVYMRVGGADSTHPLGGVEASSVVTFTPGTITGTGTGTLAGSATDLAVPGTYSLTLQSTSQTSKVTVIDPNGNQLADATVGTAYTAQGVTFTITAAGTMTAGDSFDPVVAKNTVAIPRCVFTGPADTSGNTEIAFNI